MQKPKKHAIDTFESKGKPILNSEIQTSLSDIDLQIIQLLKADGRLAFSELAQIVGMSAPGVADRVRRLVDNKVIKRFTLELDASALGYSIEAIVRIKPRPGSLHVVEHMIVAEERFTACDKVTGDDCFVARLALRSFDELNPILEPFHEKAETNTSIIKSSPIINRHPIPQSKNRT
jgi:Lrp/AsnC family transcriptional regulator, leucine-responsive regulatory protein